MADYVFDDWKKLLETFQNSVEKDLEEIHKQKAEIQQLKTDIFNGVEGTYFVRDPQRIILSAPEVIIGNVDQSGDLLTDAGRVVIKGTAVDLDGVGASGSITSRASSIRQLAVDPGSDGLENVVCDMSEIVSQACAITLQSSNATEVFSRPPVSAQRGGIRIHADTDMKIEAAVSSEKRKEEIEATVKGLDSTISNLKKLMETQKKTVEGWFGTVQKLLERESELNDDDAMDGRLNTVEITDIHDSLEASLPSLFNSTVDYIQTISHLAEANRQKKALNAEKDKIKSGDDFKKKTTGASIDIVAETISVATADGDGNLRTNDEAGISFRTPGLGVSMMGDDGKLVEGSAFNVSTENVNLSTLASDGKGKNQTASGSVTIASKDIQIEALDYEAKEGVYTPNKLAVDGKVSITAKTVEVSTAGPSGLEKDDDGKLTKGEFKAEGDVTIKSKNINMESLDYEVKDGKLATKALTKGGTLSIRAEKMGLLAADAEGKATGSISMNAKAVSVKSMDVDKEKLTDTALAAGSTMTLVSEKMYVGSKSKDIKSKKIQAVSQEVGLFADNTLEAQQGDGKAVVQLSGGNASVGGSKTQVYGDTTINAKAEIKGEVKAPKATIENLEAKSSFKSKNISDGIPLGVGGGGGSLSAKLKTEDAPKE